MFLKFTRLLMLLAIVVGLVTGTVVAQEDVSEYPTIIANADGITLPEGLVSGITTLTLQNDTEAEFSPVIARFLEGKTIDDFRAALMAQDFPGMLATISALGLPAVAPGESLNITYDLKAGGYVVLSFNPAGPPTILPFTVAENEGETVSAPEADVVVDMIDFAFVMPTELTTKQTLWQFINNGEQTHEIIIFRVDADTAAHTVTEAMMAAAAAATPGTPPEPPYERVFSFIGISPGESAWLDVSLEPGSYAALCFIPDMTSETPSPHFHHGMIVIFNVSE